MQHIEGWVSCFFFFKRLWRAFVHQMLFLLTGHRSFNCALTEIWEWSSKSLKKSLWRFLKKLVWEVWPSLCWYTKEDSWLAISALQSCALGSARRPVDQFDVLVETWTWLKHAYSYLFNMLYLSVQIEKPKQCLFLSVSQLGCLFLAPTKPCSPMSPVFPGRVHEVKRSTNAGLRVPVVSACRACDGEWVVSLKLSMGGSIPMV